MSTSAIIIADSIAPTGHRVTTMQVRLHRFVLAELNTHRVFSRNSASSRAIPVERQLERLLDDPAWPVEWPAEQAGMQGGSALDGFDHDDAVELFTRCHELITGEVQMYLATHPDKTGRLHKSLVNRLLEPFMWHDVVITSTEWDNFFAQRASEFSPLAQPEIRVAADLMLNALRASEPMELDFGDWHLPYIVDEDREEDLRPIDLPFVSAARCARVSFTPFDSEHRDPPSDLRLYERLVSARPMHASPMEHPCTPAASGRRLEGGAVLGNFTGFHQLRHNLAGMEATTLR